MTKGSNMTLALNTNLIKHKALELGFHKVGIVAIPSNDGTLNLPSTTPDSKYISDSRFPTTRGNSHSTRLQQWLFRGYHAAMAWMQDPRRQNIRQVMPEVKSVICLALNYYTPQERPDGPAYAKISRYGWGRDYHRVLNRRLKALSRWLEGQGQNIYTRYYADTGPIQEKVWAERAGVGWIGKHSNLITRDYGSWVFLGEILTNLNLIPDRPHTEHCGTCTRCIDACPTQAIPQAFVVDANRCIAYHTIENRAESLPDEVMSHLNGWVAGCDICQDVCPWNHRFAQETDIPDFQPYPWNIGPTLVELAELSTTEYDRRLRASALRRIKLGMLQRNAKANLQQSQK